MITKLNVASIMVLNKDEALDFYVNKLGLEKGCELVRLELITEPPEDAGSIEHLRAALLVKGRDSLDPPSQRPAASRI